MSHDTDRHLARTEAGYVHLRTLGEPSAGTPQVLLLHQVPASSRMWTSTMRELDGVVSVAPDMLNLGESDPTNRPLSLEEHAEYLWEASQAVWPGPKIVVGHHTGAALAGLLSGAHPDEVLGTVLIGYPYYENWRTRLAKYERLNPHGVDPEGAGVAAAWQFIYNAFRPGSDPDLIFDAFADRMRAGRVWYEGYEALWHADLHAIASMVRAHAGPKLLVAPEHDSLSKYAEVCSGLTGAELVSTSGGAFVLTEDPVLVGGVISDFAKGISS